MLKLLNGIYNNIVHFPANGFYPNNNKMRNNTSTLDNIPANFEAKPKQIAKSGPKCRIFTVAAYSKEGNTHIYPRFSFNTTGRVSGAAQNDANRQRKHQPKHVWRNSEEKAEKDQISPVYTCM